MLSEGGYLDLPIQVLEHTECNSVPVHMTPTVHGTRVCVRPDSSRLGEVCTRFSALWLQDAAKKLNLGLSVLKRLCRDIGLVRWPYRKRHSLANVISKTQRFLVSPHLPLHGMLNVK